VQLYKPTHAGAAIAKALGVQLTRACDDSRFELFFQPIVPIGAQSLRAGTIRAHGCRADATKFGFPNFVSAPPNIPAPSDYNA